MCWRLRWYNSTKVSSRRIELLTSGFGIQRATITPAAHTCPTYSKHNTCCDACCACHILVTRAYSGCVCEWLLRGKEKTNTHSNHVTFVSWAVSSFLVCATGDNCQCDSLNTKSDINKYDESMEVGADTKGDSKAAYAHFLIIPAFKHTFCLVHIRIPDILR